MQSPPPLSKPHVPLTSGAVALQNVNVGDGVGESVGERVGDLLGC
jgi:hypothetical protein